jgi:hypothetical protein
MCIVWIGHCTINSLNNLNTHRAKPLTTSNNGAIGTKRRINMNADMMQSRLSIHRFHAALKDDGLDFKALETMCHTMYKMGISPTRVLKDYLKKYKDIDIHVMYVNAKKFGLHELPDRMDHNVPTILVYMQEGWGEIINTAVKLYPALSSIAPTKYPLINFTGVTLK